MKIKQSFKGGYSFSIPELIMKAKKLNSILRRDEVKFAIMGVSSDDLNNFELKVEELQSKPSDLEMESIKMGATEVKQSQADDIRKDLRQLCFMAKMVYEPESSKLRPYIFEKLSELTYIELCYHASILARTSKKNITDFEKVNLTVEFCDSLITKQSVFYDTCVNVNDLNIEREEATISRWEVANEVYKQMSHLCEIGKYIWENVNEVSYSEYVLYPTSTSNSGNTDEITEEVTENPDDNEPPING